MAGTRRGWHAAGGAPVAVLGLVLGLALMAGEGRAGTVGTAGTAGEAVRAKVHIECRLELVEADGPGGPRLRLQLHNPGRQALRWLVWGTPWEGWFRAFLEVSHEGTALRYQGPTVKRGDPEADEYRRLPAGGTDSLEFELAPAFEAGAAGRYRIEPRLVLQDVRAARPGPFRAPARAALRPLALACPTLEFSRR